MTFYLKDVNAMGNQYIAKRHSTTGEGIGEGTQLFRYYKRRRKREEETSFDLSADPYWNFGGPSWGTPKIPAQDLRWNFWGPLGGTIENLNLTCCTR